MQEITEIAGEAPVKKKRFQTARAAIVCLLIFTVLCGVVYPITLTLVSKAAFPYEAEGSQIVVTLPDGTQRVYGSELIGQNYENPKYMFGRVNTGAPSNLSPESDEYQDLLNERIAERKENLRRSDTPIPIKFLPNSSQRAAAASIRTFRRQRLNSRSL